MHVGRELQNNANKAPFTHEGKRNSSSAKALDQNSLYTLRVGWYLTLSIGSQKVGPTSLTHSSDMVLQTNSSKDYCPLWLPASVAVVEASDVLPEAAPSAAA